MLSDNAGGSVSRGIFAQHTQDSTKHLQIRQLILFTSAVTAYVSSRTKFLRFVVASLLLPNFGLRVTEIGDKYTVAYPGILFEGGGFNKFI